MSLPITVECENCNKAWNDWNEFEGPNYEDWKHCPYCGGKLVTGT